VFFWLVFVFFFFVLFWLCFFFVVFFVLFLFGELVHRGRRDAHQARLAFKCPAGHATSAVVIQGWA